MQNNSNTPRVVHFVGIGGVGMSGLARIAVQAGMSVSGSDATTSSYTAGLEDAGVTIFLGHDASNIPNNCDVVVASTAIPETNPEIICAREKNIPIWHRSYMLAALGAGKKVIAAAGTHGKTTTSSMLATVFDELGYDPTFIVGGMVEPYGVNAHPGSGDFYIVEADESDGSFLNLDPHIALVTNIEADHLDHYEDGLQEIYETFAHFMGKIPTTGALVVCADDLELVKLAQASTKARVLTYGFHPDADVRISAYETSGIASKFDITFPNGEIYHATLRINPGIHNARNAAGVLSVMYAQDAPIDKAIAALEKFGGVHRRFDTIGVVGDVTVVDDYAHHPTEIAATLRAAKEANFRRVHVVFQPHRYTRTQQFLHEFAEALSLADSVFLLDVFSAGEDPLPGADARTLARLISEKNEVYVAYEQDFDAVVPHVADYARAGDVVITMGAGNVTYLAPRIVSYLQDNA
ncbi:MAG: UDP-N-acetylmuramate--L-alanine ligase [Eggerthellaceae bacterium]|nr:UDP-N-acetylmuramate--L-alanine ligase [Eggerthellaceae bacterium]